MTKQLMWCCCALLVASLIHVASSQDSDSCKYTSCQKGAACIRVFGFEYCNCTGTGYTGLYCDVKNDCNIICENGGICTVGKCVCAEGFSGDRCEMTDESAVCAVVKEGEEDLLFMPQCTVKSFLAKFANCINAQLPFIGPPLWDPQQCYSNVTQALHCIYDTVNKCSDLMCEDYEPTIYDIYLKISSDLYDPMSPFGQEIYNLLCDLPINGSFADRDMPLNIGSPVCDDTLMDNLWTALINYGNKALSSGDDTCSLLDKLRGSIYSIVDDSCDWSKIGEALRTDFNITDNAKAEYYENVLEIAQEYFTEWRVPGCAVSEECKDTYCQNGGVCIRYSGFEYCECGATGYTGLYCEIAPNCSKVNCENGGLCIAGTCVCQTKYTGMNCEIYDETSECAEVEEGDGDLHFLPKCSVKTFSEKFAGCINRELPFIEPPFWDTESCTSRVNQALHCIYDSVNGCSGLCAQFEPTVYDIYGHISSDFYDPTSPFGKEIYRLLCTPPTEDGFAYRNMSLNIGQPVCTNNVLDDLWTAMIDYGNMALHSTDTCGLLDMLRENIYRIVNVNCDWGMIGEALSSHFNITDDSKASYYQKVLTIAQESFLEWRVLGCEETACHCEHGGYCTQGPGLVFCTCMEGYSGDRCEIMNSSAVCPSIEDNDSLFLPTCSMRSTVEQFLNCVTYVPHVLFGNTDYEICSITVRHALYCVGDMLGSCSKLHCDSIYDIPGIPELVQGAVNTLFQPQVMDYAVHLMCANNTQHIILDAIRQMLMELNVTQQLGGLCRNLSVDMVGGFVFRNIRNLQQIDPSDTKQMCNALVNVRNEVYHTLTSSCDVIPFFESLRNIPMLSPFTDNLVRGAHVALSILREYVVPACRGVGPGDLDMCPHVSYGSSTAEVTDAYRCWMFIYEKMLSQWISDFYDWWSSMGEFEDRNWYYYAMKLNLEVGQSAMYPGRQGFIEMIRANIPCRDTSDEECRIGKEFVDIFGCMRCYAPGMKSQGRNSMMMEWMKVVRIYKTVTTVYNALVKEIREMEDSFGSTVMPPFTDFTTMFSTMSSSTTPSPPYTSSMEGSGSGEPPSSSTHRMLPNATANTPTSSP